MKPLFLALCLLATSAYAYPTVTLLRIPAEIATLYQPKCAGQSFTASDTIKGTCTTLKTTACSGRACQPTYYTTFYTATWDSAGDPTFGQKCALHVSHYPALNQWTFYNGLTAADCPPPLFDTGSVVDIQYGPYSWQYTPYYYVTTSPDGLFEIVNLQYTSYVVAF